MAIDKKDEPVQEMKLPDVSFNIPTQWAKIEQIETWVGDKRGGRAKLIVTHYCGDDKDSLIQQLETLIHGLKNDFDSFGC